MQIQFFRIPVEGCAAAAEAELNAFLRGHRVLKINRELVQRESAQGWVICVEYLESANSGPSPMKRLGSKAGKVDYREVLSEDDFAVFSGLRALSKSLAEMEGVPVYAA